MTDLFWTVEDTRYYYFVNLRYVRFFWKNEKYYDKPLYCCFTFIKTEVSQKSIVRRNFFWDHFLKELRYQAPLGNQAF